MCLIFTIWSLAFLNKASIWGYMVSRLFASAHHWFHSPNLKETIGGGFQKLKLIGKIWMKERQGSHIAWQLEKKNLPVSWWVKQFAFLRIPKVSLQLQSLFSLPNISLLQGVFLLPAVKKKGGGVVVQHHFLLDKIVIYKRESGGTWRAIDGENYLSQPWSASEVSAWSPGASGNISLALEVPHPLTAQSLFMHNKSSVCCSVCSP